MIGIWAKDVTVFAGLADGATVDGAGEEDIESREFLRRRWPCFVELELPDSMECRDP